ncbi:MAG: hypothetical protein GKS05_13260 [Nitrospirales bacterium]|nr:hypothetical protein [Nitrospirales bacterium]
MLPQQETSTHDLIKSAIFSSCNDLGVHTFQEYKGRDWRADVYVASDTKNFAFEIQMSPQSLKKTLERQKKYIRDGVIGCWLFEKAPSKLSDERPDLPLFYITEQEGKSFSVSLSGRKELPLQDFLRNFLIGNIKFCDVVRTAREQKVKLVFYEMECWKCKAMNHLYFVEPSFRSACNAVIHSDESLWGSDKHAHRPEIIALAREFIGTEQGKHIKLGDIKQRFSKTVGDSYMSFGCYSCDSIFGDWFVMEAELEIRYGYGQVATIERSITLDEIIKLDIPHWCYPSELPFCDSTQKQSVG